MIFYRNSGGGVTFSGGEATVQAEFLRELAGAFYDMGISIALETCGYFNYEEVEDIFKKMDLIFYDLKHMDEERHRHLRGYPMRRYYQMHPRWRGFIYQW